MLILGRGRRRKRIPRSVGNNKRYERFFLYLFIYFKLPLRLHVSSFICRDKVRKSNFSSLSKEKTSQHIDLFLKSSFLPSSSVPLSHKSLSPTNVSSFFVSSPLIPPPLLFAYKTPPPPSPPHKMAMESRRRLSMSLFI